MNLKWVKSIVVVAALSLSFISQAAVITDVQEVDTFVDWWDTTSWTHDINDNGFVPGTAQSATLSIEFWDDGGRWDLPELATIFIGALDFQDEVLYVPTNEWSGSLGINSLVSLNSAGLLNVTVWSLLGDFYVGKATLQVVTASVPEPSSIALLALGLIGLGLLRRKKAV